MKKISLFIIMLFSSFFNINAQKVESSTYDIMLTSLLSHSVPEVAVKEIESKTNEVIFVDSREKKEYNVSHLKNAVWVGYDSLNLSSLSAIEKDQKIIVYCSVGYRSEKVAEKLRAKGFNNVSNLYGGIFEWMNQGRQVVDKNGLPTDSVHAYNKIWGIWLNKGEKVY